MQYMFGLNSDQSIKTNAYRFHLLLEIKGRDKNFIRLRESNEGFSCFCHDVTTFYSAAPEKNIAKIL